MNTPAIENDELRSMTEKARDADFVLRLYNFIKEEFDTFRQLFMLDWVQLGDQEENHNSPIRFSTIGHIFFTGNNVPRMYVELARTMYYPDKLEKWMSKTDPDYHPGFLLVQCIHASKFLMELYEACMTSTYAKHTEHGIDLEVSEDTAFAMYCAIQTVQEYTKRWNLAFPEIAKKMADRAESVMAERKKKQAGAAEEANKENIPPPPVTTPEKCDKVEEEEFPGLLPENTPRGGRVGSF